MRNAKLMPLLLICALAISGCANSGKAVRPQPDGICPKPQEPPASLMQTPTFEQQTRDILFESPPKPTPRS